MRSLQDGSSSDTGTRWPGWIAGILLTAGTVALIWCAAVVADAALAQQRARAALARPPAAPAHALPSAIPQALSAAPVTAQDPQDPNVIGALSIPRVRLSAVVLRGTDAATLRRGPGHLEHTALPGESGNVVIAGHRDTFFWALRNVAIGDDIYIDAPAGEFHYVVKSLRIVGPHELSVLDRTTDRSLTLITCYPFWALGHAPDRFVVRASQVAKATEAVAEADVQTLPPPQGVSAPLALPEPPARPQRPKDDETVIREGIERFRVTYNARLASRNEDRLAGPLTFRACDVVVDGDNADAICEAEAAVQSGEGVSRSWSLTLRRMSSGWTITIIHAP